jgi:uroporphyrinogen decarboxylase
MMRQAGRYLPEYRRIAEKFSFFERCQTPALATEITLQPVQRLGVDAAILFSDILVIPQAMGLEVQIVEGKGPLLPDPIRTEKDLERIQVPQACEALGYVMDAIRLCQSELSGKVPLIGFAGAPWTLFCYMVEGSGSRNFDQARAFCYTQPETAKALLQKITDASVDYLLEQAVAGVDALQIFDSWAGTLGPAEFARFSLPYLEQMVEALRDRLPLILFAKGAWHSLDRLAATGAQALGLDQGIGARSAREWAGNGVTLQGNLDPAKLFASPAVIRQETEAMLLAFGRKRYIANLGHGILPGVPVDHARAFVESVQGFDWSRALENQSEIFIQAPVG